MLITMNMEHRISNINEWMNERGKQKQRMNALKGNVETKLNICGKNDFMSLLPFLPLHCINSVN